MPHVRSQVLALGICLTGLAVPALAGPDKVDPSLAESDNQPAVLADPDKSAPLSAKPDKTAPALAEFNKTFRWPAGSHSGCLKVGLLKRRFVVHMPTSTGRQKADSNTGQNLTPKLPLKLPLVIVLHGALGNAWTAEFDSGMTERANKEGFIVVYPYGTGVGAKQVLFWNAGGCCSLASSRHVDDVSFIRELIALLKRDYNADASRIYVAGASNGGMMAYRLAAELSDQIAAIGSVEGCMFPVAAKPTDPVSVIEFHGTADSVIPYAGGTGSLMGYKVRSIPPVAKTVDYWVSHDHCRPAPQRQVLDGYEKEMFSGGDGGSAVCLVSIDGGGHAWPGGRCAGLFGDKPSRKLSATDEMLDFFRQHPKQYTARVGGVRQQDFQLKEFGSVSSRVAIQEWSRLSVVDKSAK